MRSTVSVTRCTDYEQDSIAEAVARQFSLLGGVGRFVGRGDTVLLKPNFIAPKPRQQAAQTDPALILAVARIVKDFGGKPFVGDSPAWGDVFACVKALELEEDLKKLSVPIRALDKPKRCETAGGKVGISTVALEADKIINLPKLKTHAQLVATFAVKNMYGCVSGKEKAFWHFARGKSHEGFCRMLIGIYELLGPALTIIDAVTAMEADGPINGSARRIGVLIGGTDPVSCEAVCCELIGLRPEQLPMIRTAEKIGFGCSDLSKIKIVGDEYTDFRCRDFQPAEQVPLRFSLRRVCKSVCKQIVLLARSVRHGR